MGHIVLETTIAAPIESAFDAARDIDLHVESMSGTREAAIAGTVAGLIGPGESVTFRAHHFGLAWTLTSRITVFERPSRFVDEQVRGPFRWFRHEHAFVEADGVVTMRDDWQHVSPLGPVGRVVDAVVLDRYLARHLRARAAAVRRAAETLSRDPGAPASEASLPRDHGVHGLDPGDVTEP